jgi:hypothetical protein
MEEPMTIVSQRVGLTRRKKNLQKLGCDARSCAPGGATVTSSLSTQHSDGISALRSGAEHHMTDAISAQIDRIITEGAIGMAETARLLGTFRGGRPCHTSTPTRWCLSGVRLADGRILRLEHYRQAGRLMTSRAAVLRFLAAQQDPATLAAAAQPRTPAARKRAAKSVEDELTDMGI